MESGVRMAALGLLTTVVLAVFVLALLGLGQWRWQRATQELLARLAAAQLPGPPPPAPAAAVAALPPVVRRYLDAVLAPDAPPLAGVALEHRGSFDLSETEPRWVPFTSAQQVRTRRAGFVWDARLRVFPGLAVHVRDAYVAGQGILQPALAGLLPLADLRSDGDFARDELMRYLAEAPWYPTALRPGQGVDWDAVDERSARATLREGPHAVSLVFRFGADGLIESVHAAARGRSVSGRLQPTPWEGRWSAYQTHCGMRVPTVGEVAWLLPEGRKPYWRGQLVGMRCEFAR